MSQDIKNQISNANVDASKVTQEEIRELFRENKKSLSALAELIYKMSIGIVLVVFIIVYIIASI